MDGARVRPNLDGVAIREDAFAPGDAAEVGRRASFGKAERLGPQALVVEEALDALGVTDESAQFHASPAARPTASIDSALRCGPVANQMQLWRRHRDRKTRQEGEHVHLQRVR